MLNMALSRDLDVILTLDDLENVTNISIVNKNAETNQRIVQNDF